jgi:hypothetical protein
MSNEREGSKIWEITKNVAIGAGIILVAFAAADIVLLKTGLFMTSGV